MPGGLPVPLEVWDGSTGNLVKQYAPPPVDLLAPAPVFTYNSRPGAPTSSEFGKGLSMLYKQSIVAVNSTTAVVNKGSGTSFTYTNKNTTTGVYTAPAGALNKLVQNSDGSWTETHPNGITLNYNTSGQLATVKRQGHTWSMTYDTSGRIKYILDPAGRRSSLIYGSGGSGPALLRRYVECVGRITTSRSIPTAACSARSPRRLWKSLPRRWTRAAACCAVGPCPTAARPAMGMIRRGGS